MKLEKKNLSIQSLENLVFDIAPDSIEILNNKWEITK